MKKIAFIINKKYDITPTANELLTRGYSVDVFDTVHSVINAGFYDVFLIHEAYFSLFERELVAKSAVIGIANDATQLPDLFSKGENKRFYTIIALPIETSTLISYIEEAIKEVISDKTNKASQVEGGKSVLVTSFGNGCGKSLVSYNLAAKLAQFFPENAVCLVDMNWPLSIAKAMLDIDDVYSWQTLQPLLQEGVVDKQKIANIVYLTKYRFSLLSGPTDIRKNKQITFEEFKNLDTSLKKIFKVVIYDFHTIDSENSLQFVKESTMPLLVTEATATNVLQTIRGRELIREDSLSSKLKYVLNRVDDQQGKSVHLIASRLGIEPFGVIDDDGEAVNTYIQNGQLFEDKTLLLNQQIYTLAESIVRELF